MKLSALLMPLAFIARTTLAEDYADNYEDEAADDEAAEADDEYYVADYDGGLEAPSWLSYAIVPLRCVNYGGVDSIMWTAHDDSEGTNLCQDSDLEFTIVTPVGEFAQNYFEALAEAAKEADEDYAGDAYREDETYECTAHEDGVYWVKLACSDYSNIQLAMKAYLDDECTDGNEYTYTSDEGEEVNFDTGISVDYYTLPFNTCTVCVMESQVDENGDAVDSDELDENSFCNKIWDESAACDEDCKLLGTIKTNTTWDTKEIVILAFELAVFCALVLSIFQKRNAMSSKDRLIEQATAAHFGMKKLHVVGVLVGAVIIVTAFAAAKLVTATLVFMLFCDVVALGYLTKIALF